MQNRWIAFVVSAVVLAAAGGGYTLKDWTNPAPPKLVVNGPTTGVPGVPLFFDYSSTQGVAGVFVDVHPKKSELHVEHEPLKRRVRLNTIPGTYRVSIMAVNLSGQDRWETTITIPGETPCPSCPACPDCPKPAPCPQPTPQPVPDPVTPTPTPEPVKPTPVPSPEPPAGRFNVAPEVYRLAKAVNDPATAAKLAKALNALADSGEPSMNVIAQQLMSIIRGVSSEWTPVAAVVKAAIFKWWSAVTPEQQESKDELVRLTAEMKLLLREVADALERAAK